MASIPRDTPRHAFGSESVNSVLVFFWLLLRLLISLEQFRSEKSLEDFVKGAIKATPRRQQASKQTDRQADEHQPPSLQYQISTPLSLENTGKATQPVKMCYAMLLYRCSHKTYRQIMPCEKPIRHWTGLWQTKEACNRRIPTVEGALCPKCTMDRLTRLPYDAHDPNSELRQALLPRPRYVGVEPRPRETSSSPSPPRGPGFLGLTHVASNRERRKRDKASQLTFFQEAKEPSDFQGGVDFPGPWWDWDKKPLQESQQTTKAYYKQSASTAAAISSRHYRGRPARPELGFVARPHPTRVPPWSPGISSQPTAPPLEDHSWHHPTRPDSPVARSVLPPARETVTEDVPASDSGYASFANKYVQDDPPAVWFDSLDSYRIRDQLRSHQPDDRQYDCSHSHSYPYSSR